MDPYPENRKIAISLTFDDGMASQRGIAIPALEQRGLKGTFYLNPRGGDDPDAPDHWLAVLGLWQSAYENGHEIGNHTLNHPCSLNIQASFLRKNTRDMSLEDMAEEMDAAQARLQQAFPLLDENSFAYPCYESDVGQGIHRQSYVPLAARRFSAARARGEMANQPGFCDLHHLSSWNVEGMSGDAMIALIEEKVPVGHWGIFTFHGIDEGRLSVKESDFVQLLDYLADRPDDIWTATVTKVAKIVR
jgi:peptidoglycan-N-acetylglucosamine deacetylase